jgi:hypothetical protein
VRIQEKDDHIAQIGDLLKQKELLLHEKVLQIEEMGKRFRDQGNENIDLTAEDLITRLKAGNIYKKEKIQTALNNFFKTENILQLRELALKEVALRVEKKNAVAQECYRQKTTEKTAMLAK